MAKTSQRRKDNRSSNRYWSLMIVGEHGQVISMQRVKPLIWMVAVCLVVACLVAAVAVYFYLDQRQKVAGLEKRIKEMEYNLEAVKDEKDILMAKLVIAQQQNRKLLEGSADSQVDEAKGSQTFRQGDSPDKALAAGARQKTAAGSSGTVNTGDKSAAQVAPAVDIQRFQVTYDPMDQVLKAVFRIINVSRPKVGVSGRVVVVFKTTGSPPIKWRATPRVKLVDGEPDGKRGKSFRINNFKTMTFRAYDVSLPVVYDTAAVYVFDRQGKLLLQREFEFTLAREPAVSESANPPRSKAKARPKTKSKPAAPAAKKIGVQSAEPRMLDSGSVDKEEEKGQSRRNTAGESNNPEKAAGAVDQGASQEKTDSETGNGASQVPSVVKDTAPQNPGRGMANDSKTETDK